MATPERVSSSREATNHQTLDPHSSTIAGAVPDLDLKDSPTRNDPHRQPSRRPHPTYRAFFAALDQAPVDSNRSIRQAVAGSEVDEEADSEGVEEEEEEEEHLVRGIHASTKRERERIATEPIEKQERMMGRKRRGSKNMY